jgi:Flp pilus assembly secretin CpaC
MTHARRRTQTSAVGVLVVSLWFFTFPAGSAQAPSQGAIRTYTPQKLNLVVGKSLVIDTPVAIKRVSLANPDIADTVVISPRQIYLTGKAVGTTNLTLWGGRRPRIHDLRRDGIVGPIAIEGKAPGDLAGREHSRERRK